MITLLILLNISFGYADAKDANEQVYSKDSNTLPIESAYKDPNAAEFVLGCYRCCVGYSGVSRKLCKVIKDKYKYDNFNKGHDCRCETIELPK